MNIYLIEQTVNNGYDTFDSAVVIAPDMETARKTVPSHKLMADGKFADENTHWYWCEAKDVMVTHIGTSQLDRWCVVCSSFNAG